MSVRILQGDVRAMLATLEPNSVQTVCTSPPYWGLRSYGTEQQVWGGDAEHAHEWNAGTVRRFGNLNEDFNHRWNPDWAPGGKQTEARPREIALGQLCPCGAWLGELGNEPTPELFVAHMVEVFRAVWRVLRRDGTLWLNLGFSYAGSGKGPSNSLQAEASQLSKQSTNNGSLHSVNTGVVPTGYKAKDLIPIPFLVAMALQRDGWYWRSIIAWAKKAPMPESVTDRPTSAWEPVLLMSKSARYYYDADAVREAPPEVVAGWTQTGIGQTYNDERNHNGQGATTLSLPAANGRNMRNVWLLGPEPFPDAHFATFPTEVPRRCILAGTSEKGQCPQCGAPWERVIEASKYEPPVVAVGVRNVDLSRGDKVRKLDGKSDEWRDAQSSRQLLGWRPTCGHADLEPVPQIVLDPFAGAGTTLLVADRLNRHGIGIELKADYAEMARERLMSEAPMFTELLS